MALIDKLTDIRNFNYDKVGGSNNPEGNFKINQSENIRGTSDFRSKDSQFDDKVQATSGKIPPIVAGTQQSLETIEKVAKSPQYGLFLTKQFVLQQLNASDKTRIYNPLSTLGGLSTLDPTEVFDQRHFGGEDPDNKPVDVVTQKIEYAIPGVNTKLGIERFNQKDKRPSKRTIDATEVSYGLSFDVAKGDTDTSKLPEDFIKFYIKDIVGNRIIQFPAYLTDITDNSSAEYNPTRYIGRADQVYVYSGYTRSISFGFRVAALQAGDIHMMWKKVDHLKRLVLPQYSDQVFQVKQSKSTLRPVAPFAELTIGDLFRNQVGVFDSINVTIPQNSSWETEDGYQLTHMCDVQCEFKFIGNKVPSLDTKQYDGLWGDEY